MTTGSNLRQRPQSGMVLLFCLLFLTALTLLGLSATADTVMQSQLSANVQDSERARQSALAAQAWAEKWLLNQSGGMPQSCVSPCTGVYLHVGGSLPAHPENEGIDWWIANGYETGINPLTGARSKTLSVSNKQPAYWLIEVLHSQSGNGANNVNTHAWYRILARGSGRSKKTFSVVESILVRSWPGGKQLADSCNKSTSPQPCGRVAWRALRL